MKDNITPEQFRFLRNQLINSFRSGSGGHRWTRVTNTVVDYYERWAKCEERRKVNQLTEEVVELRRRLAADERIIQSRSRLIQDFVSATLGRLTESDNNDVNNIIQMKASLREWSRVGYLVQHGGLLGDDNNAGRRLADIVIDMLMSRKKLKAQLEASTAPLEFTAEEREKAWEKAMVMIHDFPSSSESHTFTKTNGYIDILCAGRRVARDAELAAAKARVAELEAICGRDTTDWAKLQSENGGQRHEIATLRTKIAALESRLSAPMPTREGIAKAVAKHQLSGKDWEEVLGKDYYRSIADAVLALLPAAKPVARELTREEIDAIAKEMYSSAPLPEQVINACIRHACNVAQPTPVQSTRERIFALKKEIANLEHNQKCDEALYGAAPEQPAPGPTGLRASSVVFDEVPVRQDRREKVIELATAVFIHRPEMNMPNAVRHAEEFLAAADAYRKGE